MVRKSVRPLRVFQVATGNVGSEMIRRLGKRADLALVGVHCYTPDKIGRDVGTLVGLEPIGVVATGSIEDIVAAKPDVVTFHGVFPDEDLYLAVLEAGINIVTTADWITGHHRDLNHPHPSGRPWTEIIDEAAKRGGVSFYGTGANPGLNQILGIVSTMGVAEIENITTIESADVSCHHSVQTWKEVGYGLPVDDPALPGMLRKYTEVFADSVWLTADACGVELDEVVFSYELGACTRDIDLGWYQMPQGSLGASYIKYRGLIDGVPKIETHLEWQMTPHTEPHWEIRGGYIAQIKADPQIYNKQLVFPAPGADFSNVDDLAAIGMTLTGMPALNALKAVVEAEPGIVTSADLPLRAFAGTFK